MTVVRKPHQVLRPLDPEMAVLVQSHFIKNGVSLDCQAVLILRVDFMHSRRCISIRGHMMTKPESSLRHLSAVAREAKAVVASAFRNGPIENVHAVSFAPPATGSRTILTSHLTR